MSLLLSSFLDFVGSLGIHGNKKRLQHRQRIMSEGDTCLQPFSHTVNSDAIAALKKVPWPLARSVASMKTASVLYQLFVIFDEVFDDQRPKFLELTAEFLKKSSINQQIISHTSYGAT